MFRLPFLLFGKGTGGNVDRLVVVELIFPRHRAPSVYESLQPMQIMFLREELFGAIREGDGRRVPAGQAHATPAAFCVCICCHPLALLDRRPAVSFVPRLVTFGAVIESCLGHLLQIPSTILLPGAVGPSHLTKLHRLKLSALVAGHMVGFLCACLVVLPDVAGA